MRISQRDVNRFQLRMLRDRSCRIRLELKTTAAMSMLAVACILALALAGCGGNSGEVPLEGPFGAVRGVVTFEGKPVGEGTVEFLAIETTVATSADIQSDGSYVLKTQSVEGAPVGKYKVTISPPPQSGLPPEAGGGPPKVYPTFPQKYRSATTSGFEVEIKEGENTFDFEMKD